MAALVVVLGGVLAGCSHTQTAGASRKLDLSLTEYRLNPEDIHATTGYLLIIVRNNGSLTHNLSISQNGQAIASTQPIPPGHAAELAVDLAPGDYSMASTLLSDEALGAYGTLSVGS
jgi:Cupredoxin-like domain